MTAVQVCIEDQRVIARTTDADIDTGWTWKQGYGGDEWCDEVNRVLARGQGPRRLRTLLSEIVATTGGAVWTNERQQYLKAALAVRLLVKNGDDEELAELGTQDEARNQIGTLAASMVTE